MNITKQNVSPTNGGNQNKSDPSLTLAPDLDLRHKQWMGFSINSIPKQERRCGKLFVFFLCMALLSFFGLVVYCNNTTVPQWMYGSLIVATALNLMLCVGLVAGVQILQIRMNEFKRWRWIPERAGSTVTQHLIVTQAFNFARDIFCLEQAPEFIRNVHYRCLGGNSISLLPVCHLLVSRRQELSEEFDSFLEEIERRFGLKIYRKGIFTALESGKKPEEIEFEDFQNRRVMK